MTTTLQDGKTANIGEWVGFKADIEQYGRIVNISRSWGIDTLTLVNEDGFHGDYVGGQTTITIDADECWSA
jgi:hypothetical protein